MRCVLFRLGSAGALVAVTIVGALKAETYNCPPDTAVIWSAKSGILCMKESDSATAKTPPIVTAPPGYTALPVVCSNEALQDNGMPCALSPEAALRQAYQYCREEFYRPAGSWCDPTSCDDVNHSESYTLPACDGIAKRWESSAWKKADDAADAKARQREIDHAKAFVEAVEKSK